MPLSKKEFLKMKTECKCTNCNETLYRNDILHSTLDKKGRQIIIVSCPFCCEVNSFYGRRGLNWKRTF